MATKSSAKKKTTKKASTKSAVAPKEAKVENKKMKHDKIALLIIAGILVLFLLAYLFKGLFVVATVNGEPITRMDVASALEKQGGQQVLESMITKKLILQEAKNKGIEATQEDINKELSTIEASLKEQETTLDEALGLQGMTREDLIEDIKLQVLIQKLVEEKVGDPNEEEIAKYVEESADFFPEGTTEEQKIAEATEALKQQKVQFETQQLITDLQENSKTIILFNY